MPDLDLRSLKQELEFEKKRSDSGERGPAAAQPPRSRSVVIAVAASLILAAGAASYFYLMGGRTGATKSVAVLPFSNIDRDRFQRRLFRLGHHHRQCGVGLGERVIELDPLSTEFNHNVGLTLFRGRRPDQAVAQFRKTLELDPRDWITMTNLGWGLIIQGKFAEAIAELKPARQLDDNHYALAALVRRIGL